MRKIVLFALLIFILSTTLAAYLLRDIDAVFTRASLKIVEVADLGRIIPGVKIDHLNFNTAQVESFRSLSWSDVSCKLRIDKSIEPVLGQQLNLWMKNVEIKLKNYDKRTFSLNFSGLTIEKSNDADPFTHKKYPLQIKEGELKIDLVCDFLEIGSIKDQIHDQAKELSTLFKSGQTTVPVSFSGVSVFDINHQKVQARLLIQQKGANFCLAVDENFFRTISNLMDEELTDSEIELLSKNPFKVAKLLEIRNFVRKEVNQRRFLNKDIPEDAYRHVLWSFLLTREYGPVFAKEMTDAHEKGDVGNTSAEHQMDYNNNAIGRQYASKGVPQHQVLNRMLNDPAVISFVQ